MLINEVLCRRQKTCLQINGMCINWTELNSSHFEFVDTNVAIIFVVLVDFEIGLALLFFWIRFENCIILIQMEYVQRWLDTLPKGKWFFIRNWWSVKGK